MTTTQRRARRVSTSLAILAGLTLAACGGSDSSGPNGPDDGLSPGEGVAISGATPLSIDGGTTGTENVLVIVDTGLASISDKTPYTVTATGTGAAGAVSAPASTLVPLTDAAKSAAPSAGAPVLDIGYGMRLNARNRARFAGRFGGARSAAPFSSPSRTCSCTVSRMLCAPAGSGAQSATTLATTLTANVDGAFTLPRRHLRRCRLSS